MATFTDILREQRKSGQGLGSSIKTAFGERAKERLDPRNYLFKKKGLVTALFPGLKGYQSKTGAEKIKEGKSGGLSGEGAEVILNSMNSNLSFMKSQFKIVAKNSIVLPQMARDTNITKQNIAKLLKSLGEKPTYGTDMFFKNAAKRESQYKSGTKEKTPKASKVVSAAPEAATGIRSIIESVGMSFRTMISGMGNGLKVFGNFLKQSVIGLGRLAAMFAPEGILVLGLVALGLTIWNLVNQWENWRPFSGQRNLGVTPSVTGTGNQHFDAMGNPVPAEDDDAPAATNTNPPKGDSAGLKEDQVGALNSTNSTLDKDKLYIVSGSNRTITSTELEKRRKGESLINDRGGINFRALGNNIGDFLGFDSSKKSTNIRGIEGTVTKPPSPAPIKVESAPAPVAESISKVLPMKSAESTQGGFHEEGIELLIQAAFKDKSKDSRMTKISAFNDQYHQDKAPGSKHVRGLASDVTLEGDLRDYKKQTSPDWVAAKRDRDAIIELASDAGVTLAPSNYEYNRGSYDGYAEIETPYTHDATGNHIHVEFKDKLVAKKYADWAKENLNLTPSTRAKSSPTTAPTSTGSSTSTAPINAPTAPMNAPDIARQKRTEYLNELRRDLNEGKPQHQQIIIDNSDKRSSVTNNGGGDSGGQIAAAGVFDTALEWYFRQQLA